MDYKSDIVDTMEMDKTAGKTYNKMEGQPYQPPGFCVAKTSQRTASVDTVNVQGGVPPCGVKVTLVVSTFNAKMSCLLSAAELIIV